METLRILSGRTVRMSFANTILFFCPRRCRLIILACFLFVSSFLPQAIAFELGFYHGLDTDPKAKGADFIMPYGTTTTAFLDTCQAAGLKVLVELRPRTEVQQVDPNNPICPHLATLKTFITGLQINGSDHPAMLGWYLYDEPEVAGVTPAQTAAVYSLIRSCSKLPVYMSFCRTAGPPCIGVQKQYASSYDILMFDLYPFTNIAGENAQYYGFKYDWRQSNAICASIANQLGKEYCPILQSMGAQTTPDGYDIYRLPTLGEARYQAHMAVQTGADRLIWFMYNMALTSKAQSGQAYPYNGTTWIGPGTNAVFSILQTEFHRYGDGIDSGEITGGIKSASDANIMVKAFYSPSQNKTYVLALNASGVAVNNVAISLNLNQIYATATRIGAGESGAVAVSGGSFFDNFTPYQAHTYELDATGQSATPASTPILACTLNMTLTRSDGLCDFSVSNDSASASGITKVILASSTEQRTFAVVKSNADFNVTPALNQPANIAINPGFESGSTGWTLGNSNYTVQSTVKHSGNSSLKYVRSNSSEYVTAAQYISVQVHPNYTYSVGCWIKTDSVTAGTGNGGALVCLEWLNASNQWIGGVYSVGLTGTNDWTFVSCEGLCPAGATSARASLYLSTGTTGTAYFDDVEILQFATDTGMSNAGFESGSAGWALGNGNYTVQSTVKRNGSNSLKYVRSSPAEYAFATQTQTSVIHGNRYSAGCWIKTDSVTAGTGGGATLCLEWYNGTNYISGIYLPGFTGTNDWTYILAEGICPAGATSAKIGLYLRQNSTGTAYFDDVSCLHRPDDEHDAVLVFISALANGSVSSTTSNKVIPDCARGMAATVFFANGYRLQGLFRDNGGVDGLSHYVAELTNKKSARVEINPSSGNQFDCRVSNFSKVAKIKRVRIYATNNPFDSFNDSDKFLTTTNAGTSGDSIFSNYAILDFINDGLVPGDSTANDQPGFNYLYCDPAGLKATVYFSDGSSISGTMPDVGDTAVTISNPGFESGTAGWTLGSNNYSVQGSVKHGSSGNSLKYVRTNPAEYVLATQNLTTVIPGNRYSVRSWIKTENNFSTGGHATLCMEWFDAGNHWISGAYTTGLAGGNDWTSVATSEMVCPANAVKARVALYLPQNVTGTAYFDDVEILANQADSRRYVFEK